jgi:hypothetical protein
LARIPEDENLLFGFLGSFALSHGMVFKALPGLARKKRLNQLFSLSNALQ